VLSSWGEDDLVPDAAVVTSELATNAVEHAVSPFRVLLRRIEDVVRITVEDVGPSRPEIRPSVPDALGGRGVAIVDQLAQVWGCDSLDDRKSVWAEMTSSRAQPDRGGR
jgi:anti-sigma regulatory factor (Ser/Thr protein kinase)